jgi:hypothetical protein
VAELASKSTSLILTPRTGLEKIVDMERSDITSSISAASRERGVLLVVMGRRAGPFVIELADRARSAVLIDAELGRQRAGGDIAHHESGLIDLRSVAAHIQAFMNALDADLAELLEQILGDAVVEDAFALDLVVFLVVEGGCVVLEMLDECAGLGPLIEDLGFTFVDAPAAVHVWFLHSQLA